MSRLASDLDITPGKVLKVHTAVEARELEQEWLDIYCRSRQGTRPKGYKWHIFSYKQYPSVSGDEALALYSEQKSLEFIVLSNDEPVAITTDLLPEHCALRDYYVFPKNMAWTMAFTHEDGWLGPYFAKHPKYDSLNTKNVARIQKNEDVENARRKGWM